MGEIDMKPGKKQQGLISIVDSEGSLALAVKVRKTSLDSGMIVGRKIPNTFYEPFERKMKQNDFRDNYLPIIVEYGKLFLSWAENSQGVKALRGEENKKIIFKVSDHINFDINKWAKNPSKKTINNFNLLNKLITGPEIKF